MIDSAAVRREGEDAKDVPAAMTASRSLAALRNHYPWPEGRPEGKAIAWSMDYGGRSLITGLISRRDFRVVLEIGSFLGGSARQWLAASPGVCVVCVDPWPDLSGPRPLIDSHPLSRAFQDQLRAVGGLYRSFLCSMWDVRDRVIPVRGRAEDVLPQLRSLGLQPDLVYLDADKRGREIAMCDELFPAALIGGDDWIWSDGHSFPIRSPARMSARARRRTLKCCGNTWLIDDRPWSVRERFLQWAAAPQLVMQTLRARVQRVRGKTSSGAPARRPGR
jgi:hypothetical protein